MALGAVLGQAESRVARNRLVVVAGCAGLLVGVAVGEPVFVAGGAYPAGVVVVAAAEGEVPALEGMADVADAVVGSFDPRIVEACLLPGEGDIRPGYRFAEPAVSGGGDFLLNHVDIV